MNIWRVVSWAWSAALVGMTCVAIAHARQVMPGGVGGAGGAGSAGGAGAAVDLGSGVMGLSAKDVLQVGLVGAVLITQHVLQRGFNASMKELRESDARVVNDAIGAIRALREADTKMLSDAIGRLERSAERGEQFLERMTNALMSISEGESARGSGSGGRGGSRKDGGG